MSRAPSLRGRWRRLKLGLPTVLGLKPRGWFIPHRYAPLLPPPGAQPPYPAIERAVRSQHRRPSAAVLDAVDAHAAALESLKSLFDQSWFPSLDAAVAYALVRERKPQHIIEVGSGHSTRVLSQGAGRAWARSSPSIPRRAPTSSTCPACASCRRPCRPRPPTCSTG